MAFDIVLRDNGSGAFDIALSESADGTASFAGTSSFSGTLVEIVTDTAIFAGTSSFGATITSYAQVASALPDVLASIEGDAEIASVLPDVLASIDGNAEVASVLPDVVASLPISDPYSPASSGSGGNSCGGGFYFPSGTFYQPDCCDFYQPGTGYYQPGDGYGAPDGGGGPTELVQLAFSKETADTVVLATRARPGFYPTDALSSFAWVRIDAFTGAPTPIFSGEDAARGWMLAALGASSNDVVSWQYRDTGAVVRQDLHTYSGGSLLAAGWISTGGFRKGTAPYTLRAFVDEEVGGSTAGTGVPQSGSTSYLTLFGSPDGSAGIVGQILAPLLVGADLGSSGSTTWQDAYYDDLGTRQDPLLFSNPDLLVAPRARSSVKVDDPVRAWAVGPSGAEVSGPTVFGLPSLWRGPYEGLSFSDDHYLLVPWASTSLASGKTLVVSAQGSAIPGSTPACLVGRASGAAGGVQVSIRNTDGTSAVFTAYDAGGSQILSITVPSTSILGQRTYYVLRIPPGGATLCRASVFGASGAVQNTGTGTPSGIISLANQRWGRSQTAGQSYGSGFGFDWIEIPADLNDGQVAQVIAGTYGGTISRWLAGVDSNVIDDGDQQVFWGPLDLSGAYASQIFFRSVGPEIVPGS